MIEYDKKILHEAIEKMCEDDIEKLLLDACNEINYENDIRRNISETVNEAVGSASTCWSNLTCAGIFESEKASAVAEDLIGKIIKESKRVRIEALKEYLELGPEEVKRLLDVMTKN